MTLFSLTRRTVAVGLFVGFAVVAARAFANPEIPAPKAKRPIALHGATIHTVSGQTIERGTLVINQGVIVAVGKDVVLPAGAEFVDVGGKHLYPGLFDAHTNLGLVELNSVRATIDDQETGSINPNVKARIAVNPDSELIPITRSNGVLLALVAPKGNLIGGQSSVMQLDGWTWEEMTVRADLAMHIHWPDMTPGASWYEEKSQKEQMEARDKALDELRRTFEHAAAYRKSRLAPESRQPIDARWEAMIPLLERKQPLIVHADDLSEIQAAVAFCDQHKINMVLYGGYDAPHCLPLLKKYNIPVILAGVHRMPMRRSDDYDIGYSLAAKLHKAGIKFCISASGHFGASNVRSLPFHAGMAVAFGLPNDAALRAITLSPAEILGVADRVGSLEVGKDATLIVTNGDPLETTTQIESAYIQGRHVDLNDRHKRLWKKYEEKYRQQRE